MRLRGCLTRHRAMPGRKSGIFKRIFTGADGVRAGWRIVLFAAIAGTLIAAGMFLLHHFRVFQRLGIDHPHHPPPLTPLAVVVGDSVLLLSSLAATGAMAWLEGAGFTAYGLGGARKTRLFLGGWLGGFAALGLLAGLLIATGDNIVSRGAHGALGDLRYGAEWLGAALLIALAEEISARGYLLWTLARGTGFWPASILLAIGFGAIHGTNPGETPIGLLTAAAAGLLFCLAIRLTGSLWWAIGFHMAWDWSENFVYGSRDSGLRFAGRMLELRPHGNIWFSGGVTGPEGSVFCLAVMALAAIATYILLRPVRIKTFARG